MTDSIELKTLADNIIDIPDQRDYLFDEYLQEENGEGDIWVRPEQYFKILDQWQTPMCSYFALWAIINGYNIVEDIKNEWQVIRQQYNPSDHPVDNIRSIQTRLEQAKKGWLIAWYLAIPKVWTKTPTGIMTEERRNKEMQIALNKGFYLYTGTDRTNWTMKQSPILNLWNEIKLWHIISIVGAKDVYHSESNLYKFVNSFWSDWGDKWYGYIKESDVEKLYTVYVVIPQSNQEFFRRYKENKKVMDFIQKAKELYISGNDEVKKYFEEIKLSENLLKLYKI